MPSFEKEASFSPKLVMGVDEVGYGAWAGPVMVGVAALDLAMIPVELQKLIQDSKVLSQQQRERIYEMLLCYAGRGVYFCVHEASNQEVDEFNVKRATHRAITRAVDSLLKEYSHLPWGAILVDGLHAPSLPLLTECVVDGDHKCLSIAAASILAKVKRDQLMKSLSDVYPGYGWETNVGYGTKLHQEGLRRQGITPYHRVSYKPLQVLRKLFQEQDREEVNIK